MDQGTATLVVGSIAAGTALIAAAVAAWGAVGARRAGVAAERSAAAALETLDYSKTAANPAQRAATAAQESADIAAAASNELTVWRKREETMRLLRWAAEMAIRPDNRSAATGLEFMKAMEAGSLLQPEDRDFLRAVRLAIVGEAARQATDGARPSVLPRPADEPPAGVAVTPAQVSAAQWLVADARSRDETVDTGLARIAGLGDGPDGPDGPG